MGASRVADGGGIADRTVVTETVVAAEQTRGSSVAVLASVAAAAVSAAETAAVRLTAASGTPLRRGLPRVPGGEPWPPVGFALAPARLPEVSAGAEPSAVENPVVVPMSAVSEPDELKPEPASASEVPSPITRAAPAVQARPRRAPLVLGSRSLARWVRVVLLFGGGAVVAAGIIVLVARGVTTLPGVPGFLARYPGEYHLPEFVEDGFPAWARWSHFLNFFFMVLIVRTGLLVRRQRKPDAFYTPKRGGKKVSLYLWLHTLLDVLWLVNGVMFVVLLFVSGHWVRIVPTSLEVFPNALSAGLQYLTLEWPVEDGWVNYNSLQQLMYFTVVFIAAPLAAISGVRMSEWWPQGAEKLNRVYPAPVARALHYPTMLFFVGFVVVHVFLVFATGALKNLNHMFAGTPGVSWVGFWWFAGGLVVAGVALWAVRPLVLASIAGIAGRVSER
ncbi:hypothetical protein GCM10027033_08130 [Leucobacter ruminantium]